MGIQICNERLDSKDEIDLLASHFDEEEGEINLLGQNGYSSFENLRLTTNVYSMMTLIFLPHGLI